MSALISAVGGARCRGGGGSACPFFFPFSLVCPPLSPQHLPPSPVAGGGVGEEGGVTFPRGVKWVDGGWDGTLGTLLRGLTSGGRCSVGVVMLHSGQSFPGTPALLCSTTGTGPGEEVHSAKFESSNSFTYSLYFHTYCLYLLKNCLFLHHWSYFVLRFTFPCYRLWIYWGCQSIKFLIVINYILFTSK